MPVGIGDKLDRYAIESILGEGGMGQVFCAYDAKLERRVALKIVRHEHSTDPVASTDAAARLVREARAVAALDHPNIVSVFDVGEVDGTIFIAMELVGGTPIRTFIGSIAVPVVEKVRWMLDVARALAAAHARGLVHRDVKPDNVIVRADGVVKVLDFGVAKRLSFDFDGTTSSNLDSTQTAAGRMVGTPRYMSPEQVRGDPVDGRSDQFSWGVVTYELLTGALPWGDSSSPVKLFAALLSTEPPPLGARVVGLPEGVAEIVERTLRKGPGARFERMDDLVAALEGLLGARALRGAVDLADISPSTRRSAPTLDPSAPTPSVPSVDPGREPPPPAPAEPARRLRRPALAALAALLAVALLVAALVLAPRRRSTLLSDMPLPSSSNPEAVKAFRAGLQAFADASFEKARQSWDRAVALDETLGAAHLRLALLDSQVAADEQDARRAYANALGLRATLSPRDLLLLDAFEPYFQRKTSDVAECERRIAAAVAGNPDDPELAFYLGYVRFDGGRIAEALAPFQRAVELDPGFALARSNVGGVLAYLGRFPESLDALDRCLKASTAATDCFWYRALIHEQAGRCEDEEGVVEAWIATAQDDYYAHEMHAKALFGAGRPPEAVEAAFEQKWGKLSEARRKRQEPADRATLAIARGDFAAGEAHLLELQRLVASEPGVAAHAEPAERLVDLYLETERPELAARVAREFLKKRQAWTEPHRVDDRAMADDPQVRMKALLWHQGGEPEADFAAFRDDWLSSWKARTAEGYHGYLWIYAFAAPAASPAEAERALAARATSPPLPPFLPQTLSVAHVGKVYRLAGKVDEALPFLRQASRVCLGLVQPYLHAEAELELGLALADRGDRPGACAAWKAVVDQWGHATPASRRAKKAQELRAKSGCP